MLRYAGLAGSALMAASAYLVGALPGTDPAVAVRATGPFQARHLVGLSAWLAGAVLLALAWWADRTSRPSLRRVLVTGALWALPLLVAPPLGSRDVYAYACQGAVYLDGHDPYAVGAAAGCPWLSAVPELWRDTPAPYGPLAVAASAAAAGVARAVPVAPDHQLLVAVGLLRAVALVGVLLVIGYGTRLARALGKDPGPALWLAAVTPLALVHAVSGAHNDALLAGLVVAALATMVRDGAGQGGPWPAPSLTMLATAGALIGLAVAVKVTAVVVLPFAVLLVGPRRIGRSAAIVGGCAVAAFALLSAVTGLGAGWVAALRETGSLVQWTSLPTGVGMAVGYLLRALGRPEAFEEAVAAARVVGLAVLLAVLAWLWLRTRRLATAAPRAGVLACGLALLAVAVLAPVFYPWYALAPLAVLALSTVDRQRWLAVATVALTFLVLPYGLGLAVLTKLPGALLAVAVVGLIVWRLAAPRRTVS